MPSKVVVKFQVIRLLLFFKLNLIGDCGCQTISLNNPGWDYKGHISRTVSGKRCQRWDKQTPHKHDQPAENHNYCRNPDSVDGGVWCYTEDPNTRWEYCSQIQGTFDKPSSYLNRY